MRRVRFCEMVLVPTFVIEENESASGLGAKVQGAHLLVPAAEWETFRFDVEGSCEKVALELGINVAGTATEANPEDFKHSPEAHEHDNGHVHAQ